MDRVKNPDSDSRHVSLRGFSWIVEPTREGVVIAIEIPSGAAVAGPFDIEQTAPRPPHLTGSRRRKPDSPRRSLSA